MPLQLLDTRNSSEEETGTFENANDTRLETIMHNQTRLYGIDIARLASMFMVVLLHNLLQGGVLTWSFESPKDYVYALFENYAIIAVNVFALISGFLGVGRKVRLSKIIQLWISAFSWSAGISLFGVALGATIDSWFWESFFPVLGSCYWYFNSYLILQLILPFINNGILRMDRKKLLLLALALVLSSSLLGFPVGLGINSGYSVLWLLVLWIAGAAMKLNWNTIILWLSGKRLFIGLVVIPFISLYFEIQYVMEGLNPNQWIQYVSPFVVIQSFCFFILSARIKIHNEPVQKTLKALSPLAFGVYLIDNSSWFYSFYLKNRFAPLLNIRVCYGAPLLMVISLTMFTTFLALEAGRTAIFQTLIVRRKGRKTTNTF